MNKAVENFEITPYNYKAMWPKFLLVKFWATYPPGYVSILQISNSCTISHGSNVTNLRFLIM